MINNASLVRGVRAYRWRFPVLLAARAIANASLRVARLRLSLLARAQIGRGARVGARLEITPGAQLIIGDDAYVGHGCTFEVDPPAKIVLGDRAWISHHCHIQAKASVILGADVLVGEFVSIRDSTHAHSSLEEPIRSQGDLVGQVRIESGAWIGRGCLVQGRPEGVTIGANSIVAANSVVTRSIPPNTVWGGVPAKCLRHR